MTRTVSSQTSDTPHSMIQCFTALARDIKLAHSVFALPFALLATFLAAGSVARLPQAITLGLIVLCMFTARTVAMAVNRWADASMDAGNPRTAKRAIPRGDLTRRFVLGTAVGCSAVFIVATAGFWLFNHNPWPLILSPLVLAYLAAYSFTKRITWLCHVVLGSALAISPLAAVIAVQPSYLANPVPYVLAGIVLCWVAGFDVIYALQDLSYDRAHGVCSMPANLGVTRAMWISRTLHLGAAVGLLALIPLSQQLATCFAVAAALTVALLIVEHILVRDSRIQHMKIAFGTINGIISLALGAAGILDIAIKLTSQ